MCLGFILFRYSNYGDRCAPGSLSIEPSCPTRTPEQCPHVVSLLSESFNAHVRCGSAMALGIGCAGTGNKVRCVLHGIVLFYYWGYLEGVYIPTHGLFIFL